MCNLNPPAARTPKGKRNQALTSILTGLLLATGAWLSSASAQLPLFLAQKAPALLQKAAAAVMSIM